MRYCKALDGLRGVAVLLVILHHIRFFPAGWIGVQMFFVLSGYLITGILHQQRELPFRTYTLGFYWRRSLRIWPLYFLYCAVAAIGLWTFGDRADTPPWSPVLTYTYNCWAVVPNMHFSPFFGHFWSLCVEEQFYLLWPFLLYFIPAKAFRGLVLTMALAGPVVRLGTGLIFSRISPEPDYVPKLVYQLLISHLDAFACGACLALAPPHLRSWLANRARPVFYVTFAALLILGFINCLSLKHYRGQQEWLALGYPAHLAELHQYVWGYSIINFFSAALVLCLVNRSLLPGLFENPLLTYVGRISYGVYVWHLGTLHLIGITWRCDPHSLAALPRFALILGTTLLLASLSYFAFEKFFLNLKDQPAFFGLLPGTQASKRPLK